MGRPWYATYDVRGDEPPLYLHCGYTPPNDATPEEAVQHKSLTDFKILRADDRFCLYETTSYWGHTSTHLLARYDDLGMVGSTGVAGDGTPQMWVDKAKLTPLIDAFMAKGA